MTRDESSRFLRTLHRWSLAAYVLQRTVVGLLFAATAALILYPLWSHA